MDVVARRPEAILYLQMIENVLYGYSINVYRSDIYPDTGCGIAIDLEISDF